MLSLLPDTVNYIVATMLPYKLLFSGPYSVYFHLESFWKDRLQHTVNFSLECYALRSWTHACVTLELEGADSLLLCGDVEEARLGIDIAADPTSYDSFAFCWACKQGHVDTIKLLSRYKLPNSDSLIKAVKESAVGGHVDVLITLKELGIVDPCAPYPSNVLSCSILFFINVPLWRTLVDLATEYGKNDAALQYASLYQCDSKYIYNTY